MLANNDITKAHQMLRRLREQILGGELAPGAVLPPPGKVAPQWEVEAEYVRRVYRALKQEGLVHGYPHRRPVVRGGDGPAHAVVLAPRQRRPRPQPRTDLPVFAALAGRRIDLLLRDHLADILRTHIQAGDWVPVAKLPSARELARYADCSDASVHQALEVLEGEGLVEREYGRGWFLTEEGG